MNTDNDYYFNGGMDNFTMWDTALSANAIDSLYNNGKAANPLIPSGNYHSTSYVTHHYPFNLDLSTVSDYGSNPLQGQLENSVTKSSSGASDKLYRTAVHNTCPKVFTKEELELDDETWRLTFVNGSADVHTFKSTTPDQLLVD